MTASRFILRKLLRCFLSQLRDFNRPLCFGKYPGHAPENAIIFFPYLPNRFSCGLTTILAFKTKMHQKHRAIADIDAIEGLLADIASSGDLADTPDAEALNQHYLGGDQAVGRLYQLVRGLKQSEPFYEIYTTPAAHSRLDVILDAMAKLIEKENRQLQTRMGLLPTDQFNIASRRLETIRDAAWSLQTEIVGNLDKISVLMGGLNPPPKSAVSAAKQINGVFNSIDRLEVRGRDSAGISLLFVVNQENYSALEKAIARAGCQDDYQKRVNRPVLVNKSISIRHLDGHAPDGRTAIALTYKVAAEIGKLGDNVRFLRNEMQNDPIFQILLPMPHDYFTVNAHTRWASVGEINEPNCHPVDARTVTASDDETGIIHVSLNGDIDNYQNLKAMHASQGIIYPEEVSCDTKIIPVHVNYYFHQGHSIEASFRLAVNDFEGSHAICMHTDMAPGKVFLALKGSGQAIFLGLAPDHYIPTSEVYGFVEETSEFLKMDGEAIRYDRQGQPVNGQVFVLDQASSGGLEGIKAMFYDGSPIELTEADIRHTELTSRDIDRQDFEHYFLKEISESPASVRRTLENRWKIVDTDGRRYEIWLDGHCVPDTLVSAIAANEIRQILFIGQGTAGVAAQACANLMSYYLDNPAMRIASMKSSELSGFMLHEGDGRVLSDTLLIPISQSGTTTDTNRAVDMVKNRGAWSISIVNRRDSDLSFKTDGVIYTSSGRDIEMSVASTKAFYSQIIAGAILGLYVAQATKRRSPAFVSNEIKQMIELPDIMERVISMKEQIRRSAQRLALQRNYWAAVGSGPNKAAADEIRIKLSELCYKTISSDFVEDKKHIDLSSEPLIIVCAAGTRRSVIGDIVKDTAIFRSHKALPVVIADAHEERFEPYAEDIFYVPAISEHFAPILNTLVGHMWGYYAALTINEGSRFLHVFREDLRKTIESYAENDLDIFEIALEKSFREKIYRFYYDLRKRQSENRLPATIGIQGATNLILLLKYLSGRLPVADFESDFGVKGTAKNMFNLLFESLGQAINAMARPVDAIKHQAKTVTVGTSRIEEKAEGLLFDALSEKNFGIEHLTLSNILVLRNLQQIIERIKGSTLYRISGVNLLGEPTDETIIEVIDKHGTSAAMTSRSESDATLKGTKKIIVRQGNVYIGKGRKDDRSILIIPIISGDPSRPNMVEFLLLLDVSFRSDVDLGTKVKALGGKHEHIKNLVQENNIVWQDEHLELVPMEDLFGHSAEKIAETIVKKIS